MWKRSHDRSPWGFSSGEGLCLWQEIRWFGPVSVKHQSMKLLQDQFLCFYNNGASLLPLMLTSGMAGTRGETTPQVVVQMFCLLHSLSLSFPPPSSSLLFSFPSSISCPSSFYDSSIHFSFMFSIITPSSLSLSFSFSRLLPSSLLLCLLLLSFLFIQQLLLLPILLLLYHHLSPLLSHTDHLHVLHHSVHKSSSLISGVFLLSSPLCPLSRLTPAPLTFSPALFNLEMLRWEFLHPYKRRPWCEPLQLRPAGVTVALLAPQDILKFFELPALCPSL